MGRVIDTGVTGGAPNLLGSFAAAARPLPQNVDWQEFGTSHIPENCGFAWIRQRCTQGDKPLNPGVGAVDFKPFLVEYNAASCPEGFPTDLTSLLDRAKRGLAVRVGNAIDLALSSSAPDGQPNDSPSLPTTATDITPAPVDGGPSGLVNTLAGLIEEAYACGATGELWIHAPAWTLPYFRREYQLEQVGNVFKLGPHTVILDQGFSNEAPTGSPAAGVGEAWLYVSGPFEFATAAPIVIDADTRGLTPLQNIADVIVAQNAIYRFDPCCIFAARTAVC